MASLNNLSKLVDSLNKVKNGGFEKKSYVDPRFYKPIFSDSGTSQTIIRFITPKNPDADPIVTVYSHKFDGNGFYYENCPTTIGDNCPVCEANRVAYNTKDEYEIEKARKRSRKQKFIANILVIKDGMTPDNNGKVFLLEFDKKIFEKIIARVSPAEGSVEDPCDIFSAIDGANFKLIGAKKTIKLGGKDITFPQFDGSSFSDPSPLDKALLGAIEGQGWDLDEFTAKDKFREYSILVERFNKIVGESYSSGSRVTTEVAPAGSVIEDDETDPISEAFDEKPKKTEKKKKPAEPVVEEVDDDSDDEAFIAKLRAGK